MRSFGTVLLTYFLSVDLIGVFVPLPFIGLATALSGFPFALKVPLRDLVVIECVNSFFGLGMQTVNIIFLFNFFSVVADALTIFEALLIGSVAVAGFSVFAALFEKGLSRFTPKRIREVLNEA